VAQSKDEAERPTLPAELEKLLERSNRSFLVSLRADGSPTAHPMTALLEEGRLLFTTYRRSAKARNIERDARVAAVYLPPYDEPPQGALSVEGRGEIRGAAQVPQRRGEGPEVTAPVAERVNDRLASGKRILLDIEAGRVRPLAPPREA
jgi:hypothetical protein